MAVCEMAKKNPEPVAEPEEESLTTVKCYQRMRKLIAKLGSHLDLPQQDVLARYERAMEEDLLREMAKEKARMRQSRPGSAPPSPTE